MNTFEALLRKYRRQCGGPKWKNTLSQQRFGKLLGEELGLTTGYSGAAISDWESGKSKIHKDDRLVLISLLKVLHEYGRH